MTTHLIAGSSLVLDETLAANPRAGVIIVHGLAEHAARYRDVAAFFAARGISCFVYDQRGHGPHPAVRTHVDRFDDFVADLRSVGDGVHERHPQLPLFVWGHSMGSVAATLLAASAVPWLRGVITSSSSLELFRTGLNPLHPFFRVLARVLPRLRIPLGLDEKKISSDRSIQRAYAGDPLIPATASLRLIVEFARACELCRERAPGIVVPWLVVHGEADEIAPAAGSRALFDLLGSADKRLTTYPKLRHEIHNETPDARAAFLTMVAAWIGERAS